MRLHGYGEGIRHRTNDLGRAASPASITSSVHDSKETVWDEDTEVGDDGRLAFTADADAMSPREIDVACSDTNGGR